VVEPNFQTQNYGVAHVILKRGTKVRTYLFKAVILAKKEEVKEYEKQIDQMVYKLYALTEDEIKIIEES
jgi:hypothetical protein